MLIQSLFMLLCIVLLIYYTCDVNICVEIDPGTHMLCARFHPLEPGVTMSRELVARCFGGHPCLREAELSACRTAASSRRFLSSPWIRRPSMVDGSGIARSSIAAAARFWSTPLEAGGSLALASLAIRCSTSWA
jgi:hypothetical protein